MKAAWRTWQELARESRCGYPHMTDIPGGEGGMEGGEAMPE